MVGRFNQLPIALSQIEKVELIVSTEFPKLFPELKNVKQLDLHFQPFGLCRNSPLSCTSLIEACPKLCRFSMQLDRFGLPEEEELVVQRMKRCSVKNNCLKVVELRQFSRSQTYVELAAYLLSSAPFLEKIIADTRRPYALGPDYRVFNEDNVLAMKCAQEFARRLATQFSPTAELVIL